MSDLLDRAEALVERYDSSGLIHRDATLMLPELIAEIKRQSAYVARLEAAYVDAYYAQIHNGSRLFGINYIDEEIKSKAREALEGIKRGEQG